MLRALASAVFYLRFMRRFSRIGAAERAAQFKPYPTSLEGQTWLVTGASGGIGADIARTAHARGAHVLALARDHAKLEALRASLDQGADAQQRWQPHVVDFSSLRSVRQGLAGLRTGGGKIDVVINNVGVLLNTFSRTDEGLESTFVSNLLSHFELTEGLRRAGLLDSKGAVINITSGGMYGMALQLEPMLVNDPAQYDGMASYAMHKRAQVAISRYWNEQWQGAPRVYAMHPGWVDTDGVKSSLPWFRAVLRRVLRQPQGAGDTALWLGTTRPAVAPGVWLDRVLDPEHAFGFTQRSAHDEKDLAEFLKTQSAKVI